MHTFFINTSGKAFDEYGILWDIAQETKKLVYLECPFPGWFQNGNGYQSCVKQIRDAIEAYTELDNSFQVIVYIDLTSEPLYAAIEKSAFGNRESKACLEAMHALYSHAIKHTLLNEFIQNVREPESILIMFGENAVREMENVGTAEPDEADIHEKIVAYIGMPEKDQIEALAKKIDAGDASDKVIAFQNQVAKLWKTGLFPDIMQLYANEAALWYDSVMLDKNVDKANRNFLNAIWKLGNSKKIVALSCPCVFCVGGNKSVDALNQLNILIHMLKCVEAESFFTQTQPAQRKLRSFRRYEAHELAALFRQKEQLFSAKLKEIECFSDVYSECRLAPDLYDFDYAKFSLDEFGDQATELFVTEETRTGSDETSEGEASPVANTGTYEDLNEMDRIEVVQAELRSLFPSESYPMFEYEVAGEEESPDSTTSPGEHIEFGKTVKKLHDGFLKKFKLHVTERLSAYAGKSKENKPALLGAGEYQYSRRKEKEKKSLETVEQVSEKAYSTVLKRYMEFCAGRAVSVTDISSHCDLFVTRIHQITESLSKKMFVAAAVMCALLVFYVPFFFIAHRFINFNPLTTLCFFASFLLPFGFTCGALVWGIMKQKRKYLEERSKLTKASEKIMEENKHTAKKYDQLLASVIPALRWVYEYKLDVQHYSRCCRIADRKLAHHKTKLSERIRAIHSILSDMESNGAGCTACDNAAATVNYSFPYCCGAENIRFYTMIDQDFLDAAHTEEVADQ